MRTVYIYLLVDENGEPFYVGKSVDPEKRLNKHLSRTRNGDRFYVNNKIRQILNRGGQIDIVVIDSATENEIDGKEVEYIRGYSETHRLCNLAPGGEGGCTKESAMKGVATRRENGSLNPSEETKKKIGEALKDKPKTQAHKDALSKAWKRTPEQLKRQSDKASKTSTGKINIKTYKCTDPEGNEYITDNGLTQFCKEHELQQALMSKVACGQREHHKGWKCERIENEKAKCPDHPESVRS